MRGVNIYNYKLLNLTLLIFIQINAFILIWIHVSINFIYRKSVSFNFNTIENMKSICRKKYKLMVINYDSGQKEICEKCKLL